ncbi:MAG TPA: ABC transporter permease [Dehalococcoidia bacterium]|nr:ABC transporter permease [Dehalococcoidia bacterium]
MSYTEATVGLHAGEPLRARSRLLRRLLRRPVAVAAIAVIVLIYGAGILAPVIAPYGFNEADFTNTYAAPSLSHPFGTDELGRDLLSRAIWSAQTTVIVSIAVVATGALAIGVTAGLVAGYLRGAADAVIMRLAEIFGSVPTILLLLIITATLRDRVEGWAESVGDFTHQSWIVSSGAPSYVLIFGSLSAFGWVGIARIVRSQVLALRETQYVIAARASGASGPRIIFWHLLPNVGNLLIVAITLSLGSAAAAEVGLTFLGIGVQSPHPSFGAMIAAGAPLTIVRQHTVLILVPAACVSALVLAFNLLGDQLTDVLSPRRR